LYKRLVEKIQIAEEEFLQFVLLFARFEYALKRTSGLAFVRGEAVYADWRKFGRELDSGFDPTQNDDLCHGIEYLIQQPPLKQILNNEGLSFVQPKPRTDEPFLVQVLDTVKTVRNNLLHGGKFPDGEVLDPARNRTLLKSASVVLRECLRLAGESDNPRLRHVFDAFEDGP
jgi:hypothetical protein